MDTSGDKKPKNSLEDALSKDDVEFPDYILNCSTEELGTKTRFLESEIRILKNELLMLGQEKKMLKDRLKENHEKIKLNNQLPYLVGNVVEVCCVNINHSFK